jgi:hypothetical protein
MIVRLLLHALVCSGVLFLSCLVSSYLLLLSLLLPALLLLLLLYLPSPTVVKDITSITIEPGVDIEVTIAQN